MGRIRLDKLLVTKGFFESRERAQEAVLARQVRVAGMLATKVSSLVPHEAAIEIASPVESFVSRGGHKLAHALSEFMIDPAGKICADIGASTGGFCDCLLRRGAAKIFAVDVGYGQIAWRLRIDPRIVLLERCNARFLTLDAIGNEPPFLITIDVSFISLIHVLPAAQRLLRPDGHIVSLVKPQFEAGRADVGKGGIVRSPDVHKKVIADLFAAAPQFNLLPTGLTESPLLGTKGNREFLVHWRHDHAPSPPLDSASVTLFFSNQCASQKLGPMP